MITRPEEEERIREFFPAGCEFAPDPGKSIPQSARVIRRDWKSMKEVCRGCRKYECEIRKR